MSNTPTPTVASQLPAGLTVYLKDGTDGIAYVNELTFFKTPGFSPIADLEAPGGDIDVIRFASDLEARQYQDGFEHAVPGDDTTYDRYEVKLEDGEVGYFLIIVWGDSSDDSLNYIDRRNI